MRSNQSG